MSRYLFEPNLVKILIIELLSNIARLRDPVSRNKVIQTIWCQSETVAAPCRLFGDATCDQPDGVAMPALSLSLSLSRSLTLCLSVTSRLGVLLARNDRPQSLPRRQRRTIGQLDWAASELGRV